jgi:hypothetical protein
MKMAIVAVSAIGAAMGAAYLTPDTRPILQIALLGGIYASLLFHVP